MSASVELVADGGAAASDREFFRSPPFLEAEGVTHTLRILSGGAELPAPLIVREIPGSDRFDAISPYGYPGFSRRAAANAFEVPIRAQSVKALDPTTVDWSPTGLVSIFLRHQLGEPPLAGASERSLVQIADPALPRKSRSSDRNQINRNRRAGYRVRLLRGPEAAASDRAGFLAVYEQTMRRASAAEHYYFGADYFDRVLESERSWLAIADAPDGEVGAASILVGSDGYLHYYLSGSADSHLRDSPMKNLVAHLVEFAGEQGLPLNLGGGISRGDRLEEFKRGFANREEPWRTSEIVCDPEAYEALSSGWPPRDYFPLYRSR